MTGELWQWPIEDLQWDRNGIALVPVPPKMQSLLERGYRVELHPAEGEPFWVVVQEYNSIAWIARVKAESKA